MNRIFGFFFAIFFSVNIRAIKSTKQIVSISIPKSGTHLLEKSIHLITGRQGVRSGPEDAKYKRQYLNNGAMMTVTDKDLNYLINLPNDLFWAPHLLPLPKYIETLIKNKNCAIFFIYRDPRDQVVSLTYHIKLKRCLHQNTWKKMVDEMSHAQLLTSLIKGCKVRCSDNENTTHALTSDTNTRYRMYMPWLDVPGVYAVRFEDLIGPQGGGSAGIQYQTIKNIALHIGVTLTDKEIEAVTSNLFGNSETFRSGKIGSWKAEFAEEHKTLFKEIAGQLLIDLGYESDFNW